MFEGELMLRSGFAAQLRMYEYKDQPGEFGDTAALGHSNQHIVDLNPTGSYRINPCIMDKHTLEAMNVSIHRVVPWDDQSHRQWGLAQFTIDQHVQE